TQTAIMTSDSLTMARVASDPVFEAKSENQEFTGSDITFDGILFSAVTIGTLVKCSRELAEDAPNFVQLIEQTLAAAFAAKLDNIALNDISGGPTGMLNWPTTHGIGETG